MCLEKHFLLFFFYQQRSQTWGLTWPNTQEDYWDTVQTTLANLSCLPKGIKGNKNSFLTFITAIVPFVYEISTPYSKTHSHRPLHLWRSLWHSIHSNEITHGQLTKHLKMYVNNNVQLSYLLWHHSVDPGLRHVECWSNFVCNSN